MAHPARKLCTDPILRACMLNLLGMLLMMGIMAVAFPFFMIVELQATPVQLASLQVVGGITSIAAGIVFGTLIDRYSSTFPYHWVLPMFGMLQSLCALIYYFAAQIPVLYIAQILMALSSPFMIMLQKNMMRCFSMQELTRVQPLVMGSLSMLMLALPNAGAALSAIDFRLPFLVGSINAGTMAVISLASARRTRRERTAENQTVPDKKGTRPNAGQVASIDWTSKIFMAHLLLSTPLFVVGDLSTASVKLFIYIERLLMLPSSLALMMTATTIAGGVFSIAIFRRLVNLLGPLNLRVAGALLNIGGAIVMANVTTIPMLIAALACDVVATNVYQPCASLLVKACVPPAYHGRFAAFQATVMEAGGVLAPALGSVVYSVDNRYPWYLFKVPMSFMAACVNLSMIVFACRVNLYRPISRLQSRF